MKIYEKTSSSCTTEQQPYILIMQPSAQIVNKDHTTFNKQSAHDVFITFSLFNSKMLGFYFFESFSNLLYLGIYVFILILILILKMHCSVPCFFHAANASSRPFCVEYFYNFSTHLETRKQSSGFPRNPFRRSIDSLEHPLLNCAYPKGLSRNVIVKTKQQRSSCIFKVFATTISVTNGADID